MAGSRSSARLNSSSPQTAKDTAGTKRKADGSSPSGNKAKRGRPSKDQKTLEETISGADPQQDGTIKEAPTEAMADVSADPTETGDTKAGENGEANGTEKQTNGHAGGADGKADGEGANEETNGKESNAKADEGVDVEAASGGEVTSKAEGAVEEDEQREKMIPSNVLEKGIIYFFSRGRVGVDDPDSVQDIARSYFVLRPLPDGAKLTDGAIQDVGNNRLIALPKKVWPKRGKDRFMAFVEKGETSMATLKDEFFSGSEYTTKTVGVRSMPEVTPLGEGVYAITSTGGGQGTTHLAYMLTIPSEVGEVQKDMGIAEKGSFVLSLKNPEKSGPANAQLPEGPDYPKEIIDEFRDRAWMPLQPKHLNYANAQMLLIGEDFDTSSNLEPAPKDQKDDSKETPQEEIEKLENEDKQRAENLKGDDTIFTDLGISSKEYPKVMTTW